MFKNLFRIKAKCKRFYDLNSSTFDLEGINADILGKFTISTGKLNIDRHGHKDVSEELLKLDLHQYTICESINALANDDLRDKERIKLIETQTRMMELLSGISSNIKPKVEKTVDSYKLIILYLDETGQKNYYVPSFGIEEDTTVKNFLSNFPRIAKTILKIELTESLTLAYLSSKTWANENEILAAKPIKSKYEIAIIDQEMLNKEPDKGFLLTIAKTLMK